MKQTTSEARSLLSRRTVFAGAGAVGAAVVAARLLPESPVQEVKPVPAARVDGDSGGYRLSEHVQSYYKTIRV